jgi:transposase
MYLRISKGRQKSYLVLVEGYRDENGKSKQRTITNLGEIDEKTKNKSLSLGKKLLNQFGSSALIDGSELCEEDRKNWGAYEVISKLWQTYNMDNFFDNKLIKRRLQYDLSSTLQLMLAGRLCNPTSKLALYEEQDFYDGFAQMPLQNLYKSFDELHYYKDDLSKHLFNRQQQINGKMQVSFFDVTTMYFESKKADDLREFGFSKDCKFSEVQIVLSLLTDEKGNPLSYEIFKGNMYEGHTMLACLDQLRNKYNAEKIVIVADRGMYSSENLELISSMGFEYIVGTKLRNSSADIKKEVLNSEGYNKLSSHVIDDEIDEFKYKEIANENRKNHCENIVAAWSSKRAKKDACDRMKLVDKAMKLASGGNVIDKRGGKKYLKIDRSEATLDEVKIAADAQWDGRYGISTNSNLGAKEVISAYHNLWRIEDSFRLMKSYFETRPMFHWTAKRISGHIMLNFISMIFERYLENKINERIKTGDESGVKISPNKIRAAVTSMQRSRIAVDSQHFLSYSKLSENAGIILKTLSIKTPKSTMIN